MIITYIYPKNTNVADTGSPSHPALYQDSVSPVIEW